MADCPPGVVAHVAQALIEAGLLDNAGYIPGDEERAAEVAVAALEEVWPHSPPGRDLASTVATRADLRLPPEVRRPDRPPPRSPRYGAPVAGGGIGFLGDPRRDVISG